MREYDIAGFLREHEADVLKSALIHMDRAHLPHYDQVGVTEYTRRLTDLLDTVIECCASKTLKAAHVYADGIAASRQVAGYLLHELQMAIEVLELSVWNAIVAEVPAESLPYALGMTSTSIGAIKDRIAEDYVASASEAVVTP